MISRRSLITKAPVAAATVAAGGLLLPGTASAHDEGIETIVEEPTNLEAAWLSNFVLTGGPVNVKTWEQAGQKALMVRENSAQGQVLGHALEADGHVDMWWQGEHWDHHHVHAERRRQLAESAPDNSIGGMGLGSIAEDSLLSPSGSSELCQYTYVTSLISGSLYMIADYFKPDAGWRRLILVSTAAAVAVVTDVVASVASLDLQLAIANATFAGTELSLAIAMGASAGAFAPVGAAFMLGALVIYGATRSSLLSQRATQVDRLYPYFSSALGAVPATVEGTINGWPEFPEAP